MKQTWPKSCRCQLYVSGYLNQKAVAVNYLLAATLTLTHEGRLAQPHNAQLRHKARLEEALQAGAALHSPHAHERRLSSNHNRPTAATIKTTMMLHGVNEARSSLGDVVGFESRGTLAADTGGIEFELTAGTVLAGEVLDGVSDLGEPIWSVWL